jgi:hypothetical protein
MLVQVPAVVQASLWSVASGQLKAAVPTSRKSVRPTAHACAEFENIPPFFSVHACALVCIHGANPWVRALLQVLLPSNPSWATFLQDSQWMAIDFEVQVTSGAVKIPSTTIALCICPSTVVEFSLLTLICAHQRVRTHAGTLGAVVRYSSVNSYYFVKLDRTLGRLNLGMVQGGVVSTTVVSNYTFGVGYKVGLAMAVRLYVNATAVTASLDGAVVASLKSGALVDGLPGFFGQGDGWFDNAVVTTQCDGGFQCLSTCLASGHLVSV